MEQIMTTVTQPKLPVPQLQETLSRYLHWLKPLVDDNQWQTTQQLADDFAQGIGQELQQDLLNFAKTKADSSWLHDAWSQAYLSTRSPTTLVSDWTTLSQLKLPEQGLGRLAHLLYGLAVLSADYLNNTLEPNVSPRGEPLDMRQWRMLGGMARVPQKGCDSYTFAPTEPQTRYAVIFYKGQQILLPLLDKQHRPFAVEQITTALQHIVENTQPSTQTTSMTAISLTDADNATDILAELLAVSSTNKQSLTMLNHSLVAVCLEDEFPTTHDDCFNRYGFLNDVQLWSYKPLTICADLHHEYYYLHIEHSFYDGGTAQSIMQRAEKNANAVARLTNNNSTQSIDLPLKQLQWQLLNQLTEKLQQLQTAHNKVADNYRVKNVEVVVPSGKNPPRISGDAMMQLIMQYAQFTTFDRIRNTYEAIDVSHFQAGRTEGLRPVSEESVEFVRALIDGTATIDLLTEAVAEHKNRIKACKSGHGANRHLLGLQLIADNKGLDVALFNDPSYQCFTTDFLSTSSLGNRWYTGDFAFAPTSEGGIGISYFSTDTGGFWFCISYLAEQQADIDTFAEQLQAGCNAIYNLFD